MWCTSEIPYDQQTADLLLAQKAVRMLKLQQPGAFSNTRRQRATSSDQSVKVSLSKLGRASEDLDYDLSAVIQGQI